ncbi:S8 family serine peptidase [Mucilaginibacter sp. HMF5004]|uniref:S8 family serine peptidase n=1 Tax=Mucilaginibacter rivuli TaxID=2857527 RepID=UPI001C5E6159|nr:S8 family serine peptidase [Mucilaginibacter rivuli]MBW4888583.1 S8 family serine peptidase [Mucilaginibacter rivuli]
MNNLFNKVPCFALAGALLLSFAANAQNAAITVVNPPPKNWHQLDYKTDGYYGISLKQAYQFLQGKKSKTVIVATIDSGCDTAQTDLKSVLWTNPKEIPGNGIDDDHDGYVDNVHGWNFLGGPNNKCDYNETTEEIREYAKLKDKYLTLTAATATNKKEFAYWQKVQAVHDSTVAKSAEEIKQLTPMMNALEVTSAVVKRNLNISANGSFNEADLDKLQTANDTVAQSKNIWSMIFQQEPGSNSSKILSELTEELTKDNNDINPDLDARKNIVGDNPDDNTNPHYGNNNVKWEDASHGTGVAGLIGAVRGNGYGIDGVADNVRIMPIKAVPNGDEYDKDIANAIRYAVDHGARVINMSFGKKISPHKDWVDAAFKYAAAKNVLLVQAAGNDNQNVDLKPEYPNDTFADGSGSDAANVICVGASAGKLDRDMASSFSNYGKKGVDVFAPGVKVTSIDKDAEFNTADGTSFASPITAGIAALVMEYYPKLSARQVKQVILQSAKPLVGVKVLLPGSADKMVDFTSLSKTGGIVNAYQALLIASKMKGELK